jgi:hypothetical protein
MLRHVLPQQETAMGISRARRNKMQPDTDAYSVEAFAQAHSISVGMFYKLRSQGLAPPTFKVGARTLITREAAARWRAEREAAEKRKKSASA